MADYTSSKTGAQIDTILGGTFGGDVTINGVTFGSGAGGVNNNTVSGLNALQSNTTGEYNTAVGRESLRDNTTGQQNTASGNGSLAFNTTGTYNTANGVNALRLNTTGSENTATGTTSLNANTTGTKNTACGMRSLENNTTGIFNTAVGFEASKYTTTGERNSSLGLNALYTNTTGDDNIAIGYAAISTSATISGQCTLGNATITNLRCNDTSISSLSDERDKTNIVDIPLGLDFINTLRPVSFDWDRRDGSMVGKKDFGFIAQELKAAQEATVYSESMRLVCEDNPERIEADPMKTYPVLVKAIQELSAKIAELEAKLAV